jgi:hypothetical protein
MLTFQIHNPGHWTRSTIHEKWQSSIPNKSNAEG